MPVSATVIALSVLVAAPSSVSNQRPTVEPTPPRQSIESFPLVRNRLNGLTGARVSTACGSAMAPWAYRGKFGRETMLRPLVTDRANRDWAARFVATLFHESDWDSVHSCPSNSRPCGNPRLAPIFAVTLRRSGDEVYVTLHFGTRCAQVFEANHPFGVLHFDARADSVFALVKEALHSDRDVRAMEATPPIEDMVSPGLIPDSSRLELPHVLSRVPPEYPEPARRRSVEGTVWIQALVGTDGRVKDAFTKHSIPALDDAALDAIWRWQFQPAKSEGEPTAVWVMVPVKFTLR